MTAKTLFVATLLAATMWVGAADASGDEFMGRFRLCMIAHRESAEAAWASRADDFDDYWRDAGVKTYTPACRRWAKRPDPDQLADWAQRFDQADQPQSNDAAASEATGAFMTGLMSGLGAPGVAGAFQGASPRPPIGFRPNRGAPPAHLPPVGSANPPTTSKVGASSVAAGARAPSISPAAATASPGVNCQGILNRLETAAPGQMSPEQAQAEGNLYNANCLGR